MKKLVLFCCIAVLLLTFTACKNREQETVTEDPELLTETLYLDDVEILVPTDTEETTSETEDPERLAVLEWGTYNGYFVEDGSDRQVENVPCLLIHNNTGLYLDYGVINAVIGGEDCSFVVTGLPGGATVWVLEESGRSIVSPDSYSYTGQTLSQLKDVEEEDRVQVRFLNGELEVTNTADVAFSEIRVYYKLLNSDGHFLGGITYTTNVENLEPGETVTLTAGHSTENGGALVRVDCTE